MKVNAVNFLSRNLQCDGKFYSIVSGCAIQQKPTTELHIENLLMWSVDVDLPTLIAINKCASHLYEIINQIPEKVGKRFTLDVDANRMLLAFNYNTENDPMWHFNEWSLNHIAVSGKRKIFSRFDQFIEKMIAFYYAFSHMTFERAGMTIWVDGGRVTINIDKRDDKNRKQTGSFKIDVLINGISHRDVSAAQIMEFKTI